MKQESTTYKEFQKQSPEQESYPHPQTLNAKIAGNVVTIL